MDDLLPTRNGQLIYLRSSAKNEFWSALLEKAYAKLHGSYKSLEGGLSLEAAVDFTGGLPELIPLNSMKADDLYHLMVVSSERGAFMGSSIQV